MKTKPRIAATVSLIFVLLLAATAARMWQVHEETWDWRLWPAEVSQKIHFAGRDFNCGEKPQPYETQSEDITAAMSPQGTTPGGATILSLTNEAGIHIGVRASDGLYVCSLMGGL